MYFSPAFSDVRLHRDFVDITPFLHLDFVKVSHPYPLNTLHNFR